MGMIEFLGKALGLYTTSEEAQLVEIFSNYEKMEARYKVLERRVALTFEDVHKFGVYGTNKDVDWEKLQRMTLEELWERVRYWQAAKKCEKLLS